MSFPLSLSPAFFFSMTQSSALSASSTTAAPPRLPAASSQPLSVLPVSTGPRSLTCGSIELSGLASASNSGRGSGVLVGFGVFVGLGVAVGFGVLVGLGVAVGFGVFVGLGVAVVYVVI